ncbi:hypothetical protein [Bacillus sp. T3]|uniref:hypothetical protein n=1 Tax=Bacillus sp. T3 TaxID=467262 RepID=UPI002981CA20|nr:hypothetical protein [Bacillus sp. T3]
MKAKIHRCNCRNTWSIQNRKTKMTAKSVLLNGEWAVELKPERHRNPKGFVAAKDSRQIILNPSRELLEQYKIVTKLIYDKYRVNFNFNNGNDLFFAEDGACYLVHKSK